LTMLIFLALIVIVFSRDSFEKERELFKAWKLKYNKTYSSESEENSRFHNFRVSLDRVRKRETSTISTGTSGATYGLTKFADMSVREFRTNVLMKKKNLPK